MGTPADLRVSDTPAEAEDFATLRRQGIDLIQRLAGGTWTDHNTHDPGITILEQFCYALTDLDYRTGFDLPDLLTRAGEDPYASLFTPAMILPSAPVTVADLRRLVIDVPGVKNAWIDPAEDVVATYAADRREVSYPPAREPGPSPRARSPNVSEIRTRGMYRVLIEKADDATRDVIRREAAERLHRVRGLGEDFQQIEVLGQQSVRLGASLEIEAVADPAALLAEIYRGISESVSPSVAFHTLDEMLERGWRVDELFEGPLLDHGFIDPEELARTERPKSVRISDLIHAIMAVPGVVAVKDLRFLTSGPGSEWLLEIDENKTPRFEWETSDIRLERRSVQANEAIQASARRLYEQLRIETTGPAPTAAARDLRPQPGRDRDVARYHSILRDFPMAYGVGPAGLSRSAAPERRARAKQLQGYLMFYDQVLANQFAQLANVDRLFSFHDETPDSYFSQVVPDEDDTLGLDTIRNPDPEGLQRMTEDCSAHSQEEPHLGVERRNRFLDHLLARFGEQFHDRTLLRSGADADETLASDKRAFLRDYPEISRHRGTAFDCLAPAGEGNRSGLELTLRRKLGVRDDEPGLHVVEHVLLRPVDGDRHQSGPLFGAAQARDPYSLQISIVFPGWTERFRDPESRGFAEQTVRDETPAHLTAHVHWLEEGVMREFESAYAVWLERLREHRRAELGI